MGVLIQLTTAMVVACLPGIVAASEAQVEVDANLVTALDTSRSVGRYEEFVEREGLAHAVADPRFWSRSGLGLTGASASRSSRGRAMVIRRRWFPGPG
jgi:hypothetical protein